MPLLNFQKRFVEPIRLGIKAHTIRADRKIPIKVGDKLYLYCGARHPGAFRILPEPVPCTQIRPIILANCKSWATRDPKIKASIDGADLDPDELERLAVADGFNNWTEMAMFWSGRYPFFGQIIHWKPQEVR